MITHRNDGDGIVLAQPAAGEAITAQASSKGPSAFNGKNRPIAQLKILVLENAVNLRIGGNCANIKAPSTGHRLHGDMKGLVGIEADHDVWMVPPLRLNQRW